MVSVGKQYMVFKPKEKTNSKGERVVSFSIGNSTYNKATNSWESKGFINVCVKTNQFINDRDKVTFSKITGLDTSVYDGKTSVIIYAELEGESAAQENYESIPESELPF